MNWNGSQNPSFGFYADVSTDPNFSTFWNKQVWSNSTSAPSGFGNYFGLGGLVLQSGTTYFARVFNGQHSNVVNWSVQQCSNPTPTPTPLPNISITKNVINLSNSNNSEFKTINARPGDLLEFVIRVNSFGNTSVNNVRVFDNLPSQLQYLGGSTTIDGSFAGDSFTSGSGISLGSMFNQNKTIRFRTLVRNESFFGIGTTQVTNSTFATADNVGSVNDRAFVSVTRGQVQGAITLQIQKSGKNISKGEITERLSMNATPNDTIEFTVRVKNISGITANNVFVTDTLPTGMSYINNSSSLNGIVTANGITGTGLNIGSLASNQEAVIKFSAIVNTGTIITAGTTVTLTNISQARAENYSQIISNPVVITLGGLGIVAGALDIKTGASGTFLIPLLIVFFASLLFFFRSAIFRMFRKEDQIQYIHNPYHFEIN
ncbi:MAG: hypothetical protein COV30_01165 [Candidatus Yanofskybacteria bacterium CG10_big_fil_rev_8_21_14_0_10_37_15]|uniref:DUF11 domain-containing protein n=1 Tax=Candidatus Yanofskybacteria bacterium CG10_big_fil_rev_8_21_14_0_10_37_15 TaxID=1975097 RepID=A0A2H0R5W3_9BACT|nr:MAG: hypothetical protein COV30_01165 [Candidatus Yanofskybacteria bacterium CG10_big_fil_rev_8_21_14_0_10_37_15]